ncbi:heme-binding protein [Elioraea sp.]|uniref:SOUL family heme-binding protein n=1 Tax=Elioraea sp. TaxID=2185103 RepID=UPI0025C4F7A1|nr:heme-binding protein [Elioraea sp.]
MLRRAFGGLAAIAAAAVTSACTVVGVRDGTEEPRYDVVGLVNGAEVRRYAPRLAAEVTVGGDEVAARSNGFRPLASYIFGANEPAAKIAMTAPVSQAPTEKIAMTVPVVQSRQEADTWTIRFFMPAEYTAETLPRPRDGSVRIVMVPEETFAVLRFSGSTGPDAVSAQKTRLMSALATGPWAPVSEPEAWFYDPPWTIPNLRRNEVVVRVTPREAVTPSALAPPPA